MLKSLWKHQIGKSNVKSKLGLPLVSRIRTVWGSIPWPEFYMWGVEPSRSIYSLSFSYMICDAHVPFYVRLFNNAVGTSGRIASNGKVTSKNEWIGTTVDGSGHDVIEGTIQGIAGGTEANHRNPRRAGLRARCWAGTLPSAFSMKQASHPLGRTVGCVLELR